MVRAMSTHVASGVLLALASAQQRHPRVEDSGPEGVFMVLGAAVAIVVLFFVLVAILRRFLFICGPHEVLVFSGRKCRLPDGTMSNYTVMHGGRGFRRPFLEQVRRLDMRLFPVEVVVHNAYSVDQIPLIVHAIANVKISSNPQAVRNAAERFLYTNLAQIASAAQQTLEGVLREVVSQLSPEQVNEDRLRFADTLEEHARDDLYKLGLELDVLKIQHVADEQDYLKNLGRGRIAEMLRDAENAENAAKQAIAEADAEARQRAETAQKRADTAVVVTKNEADAELAKLDAGAKGAENQTEMATETARVKAEQKLQQLRSDLEQLRLRNDVVLPAEAKSRAAELKAQGEAAPAIEQGKSAAAALRAVSQEWAAAGDIGREVYLLQQLPILARAAGKRVGESQVGTIRVVAGDERAYATVLASHAAAVGRVLEQTCKALGVDLGRLMGGGGAPPTVPPARTFSTTPTLPGGTKS
jgi:flotillin